MKKVIGILITAFLLIFCGCFDYEESVVLKSDLSGTIQMKFSVEKTYLDQMFAMTQQMAQAMPDMEVPKSPQDIIFNKDEITQGLADQNNGLVLVGYEVSEVDDKQIYDMMFSFKDINNIDLIYDALSPDEEKYQEEDDSEHQPLLVKQSDGTYLFFRSFKDDNLSGGEGDGYYGEEEQYQEEQYQDESYSDEKDSEDVEYSEMGKKIEEGLAQLSEEAETIGNKMSKNKLQFSITFPGKIIESNATRTDGNTLMWEYSMEELQATQPEQRVVIKF